KKHADRAPAAHVKVPSCALGAGRDILKPRGIEHLSCETSLAVVIAKKCKHVAPENAYDVIAGYTILNNVSGSRAKDNGKSSVMLDHIYDTLAPLGPWVVTKVEINDPMNLRISTRINGEVRQDGSSA